MEHNTKIRERNLSAKNRGNLLADLSNDISLNASSGSLQQYELAKDRYAGWGRYSPNEYDQRIKLIAEFLRV